MTREEVLDRLRSERSSFDSRVAAIPRHALYVVPEGRAHSAKDVIAHVTAYEELIVERLRAARRGEMTAFERDREGWEAFNERVWAEAKGVAAGTVLERSRMVFAALLDEVARLTDDELSAATGVTDSIDQAWLEGRPLFELIGIDAFEHYPMHYEALGEVASRR